MSMVLPLNYRVIYGLLDTRDGTIRYVGVTKNPQYRLSEHLRMPVKEGAQKNAWIKGLLEAGLTPAFVFLDSVKEEVAAEREYFWVEHFQSLSPLYNYKLKKSYPRPCKKENV